MNNFRNYRLSDEMDGVGLFMTIDLNFSWYMKKNVYPISNLKR